MIPIFEILSELGSGPVWLYRFWGCIFSSSYRSKVRFEYSRMSKFGQIMDFVLSTICFAGELVFIIYFFAQVAS